MTKMVKQELERDEKRTTEDLSLFNTEKFEVDFKCRLMLPDEGGEKAWSKVNNELRLEVKPVHFITEVGHLVDRQVI